MSLEAPNGRTRVRRHPERARYDRETVFSILDEALICHLGVVDAGTPFVLPTMYARAGETIYIHGAPASRMLKTSRSGIDVCLTVTLLDGLVMARSVFSHSMNYRSVMVVGRAEEVTEQEEKLLASRALVEHVCRGRWAEARQPSLKELAATLILRLELSEVSAKVRAGGPLDKEEDLPLAVWAGEIPLRMVALAPITHDAVPEGTAVPGYAEPYRRPGWTEPAG